MKKFYVNVIETVSHSFEIEAENETAAKEEFNRKVNDGELNWSHGDYSDFRISDIEEVNES